MTSHRCAKLYSLCGAAAAIAVMVALLLFGVTVLPISAKKVDPLDKHVSSPVRLALTQQGELLLSDYLSQSVLIIDPVNLGVLRKIKIKGRPTGLGSDGGVIYVGNETTRRVEVYNKKGRLISTLGDGEITLPNDIAVDQTTGQVFVVDVEAKQVRLFDAGGQEIGIIPAPIVTKTLAYPTALTIDPDAHRVYVSDLGPSVDSVGFSNRDARVRIYGYDGSYVDTLTGSFTRPQGLAINPDGYLYLADSMRGQVLVFDLLSKSLVKTIGSSGTDPGQLSLPLDVAINADTGDLWVANNRAGRLEVFPGGGVAP